MQTDAKGTDLLSHLEDRKSPETSLRNYLLTIVNRKAIRKYQKNHLFFVKCTPQQYIKRGLPRMRQSPFE